MRMRNFLQKYKANLYLVCFVLAAVAVISAMFLFGEVSLQRDGIQQENHTFDFSAAVPLAKTHRYYLRGNWEFYYAQFLSEGDRAVLSDSLSVPGSWAGSPVHNMPYENGGYASYRCFIEGLSHTKPLAITVPNLACAYRVYVDGVLATESGTVSDTYGETFTSPAVHKDKVYVDNGLHEIIIEVSADSF